MLKCPPRYLKKKRGRAYMDDPFFANIFRAAGGE
jgi:hypothetical protein